MKKVLIIGENSYIGNSFYEWTKIKKKEIEVNKIGAKSREWSNISFSNYDTILHVAGIAHVSKNKKMKDQYYKINTDLTYEIAKKAKNEGVKHFIFLSSMIVYGDSSIVQVINKNTKPSPVDYYGDSKLQAEKLIINLESPDFYITIVRPPMVYGNNSKGNYRKLAKLAQLIPLFPKYKNERSMIHIDNLSEFISLVIISKDRGIFHPQNNEYVSTSNLVKLISNHYGKHVKLVSFSNILIGFLIKYSKTLNKLFGDFKYDKELSKYHKNYNVLNFQESIKKTEI